MFRFWGDEVWETEFMGRVGTESTVQDFGTQLPKVETDGMERMGIQESGKRSKEVGWRPGPMTRRCVAP